MKKAMGRWADTDSLRVYTSIWTILAESSALYTIFTLMFIIAFVVDQPLGPPERAQIKTNTNNMGCCLAQRTRLGVVPLELLLRRAFRVRALARVHAFLFRQLLEGPVANITRQRLLGQLFLPILGQIQIVAPLIIALRISQGRAVTGETVKSLSSSTRHITAMKFSNPSTDNSGSQYAELESGVISHVSNADAIALSLRPPSSQPPPSKLGLSQGRTVDGEEREKGESYYAGSKFPLHERGKILVVLGHSTTTANKRIWVGLEVASPRLRGRILRHNSGSVHKNELVFQLELGIPSVAILHERIHVVSRLEVVGLGRGVVSFPLVNAAGVGVNPEGVETRRDLSDGWALIVILAALPEKFSIVGEREMGNTYGKLQRNVGVSASRWAGRLNDPPGELGLMKEVLRSSAWKNGWIPICGVLEALRSIYAGITHRTRKISKKSLLGAAVCRI
ncbi:hypothetical protein DFP72DRAFT_1051916 [Ephemerocybe angulata]|uniref:Uncharacterized protein n=1 Tax=Ephemerocybe angulata TaxID=980116 RepID=A0A8H6LWC5_9AGAR|nr:hypothetical protein DFP72DRAFT_1051916 [Tulosesus angulatus]